MKLLRPAHTSNPRPMKSNLLSFALLCSLLGCTAARKSHREPAYRVEAPPFIFMDGEFRNPGAYAWTNGMTLRDGIDLAGGFTEFAPRTLRLQHWHGSIDFYR